MRYAIAVAALVGAAGCTDLGPEVVALTDLEEARERWEDARPSSYVYEIERLCFCAIEAIGPVRVQVQGSAVVERLYVDSGATVPPGMAELFPTVDGLFDILASALAGDAHEVRAEYDPNLGVPTEFWIDYIELAADDELGMRVTGEVQVLGAP